MSDDEIDRFAQLRDDVDLQLAFDQRARKPERRATQRERILVAGRLHADRENAGERVESFGDGEHLRRPCRCAIASPAKRGA